MFGLHMLNPRLLEFKETITFPAVMVIATNYVVFSPRVEAPKVDVAVVANPVGIGICFVMLQGLVVSEPLVTANAIRHRTIEGDSGPGPK